MMRTLPFSRALIVASIALVPASAWSQDDTATPLPELRAGQIIQDRFNDQGEPRSFRLFVEPGEAVQIDAQPPEGAQTDPKITVYRPGTDEIVASDDDSGGGTSARLFIDSELGTEFRLEVSSFLETPGSFELLVRKAQIIRAAPIEPLEVGAEARTLTLVMGAQGASGGEISGQLFKLGGALQQMMAQGRRITIEMRAAPGNLDPLLEAGFRTPLGFAVAVSDDDGGGGLDARLELNLEGFKDDPAMLDDLIIRARSLSGVRGDYTIVARSGGE